MSEKTYNAENRTEGSFSSKKGKRSNVIAFVLCLLIAFVIWAYTMSYGDGAKTDQIGDAETSGEVV